MSMTLSGLMSRWVMPLACAASRPSAIWMAIDSASGSFSGPSLQCFSLRGATFKEGHCDERADPSAWSISYTVQMLG